LGFSNDTRLFLFSLTLLLLQTLPQQKTKNMLIRIDGKLDECVTSKDIILHIIGIIGTAGGNGYTIEFAGEAVEAQSMEARMSISNMAIEAGARAGIIAPDQTTYDYLKGRPMCPTGDEWDRAVAYWESLRTDEGAEYDKTLIVDGKDIPPTVTWGTSPQDVAPITGNVPISDEDVSPARAVSELTYIERYTSL
jgi:3-isopropylmalate dehydratase